MIDIGFLEKLLDLLNRSDAHTIEIRKWTTSVRISKGGMSGMNGMNLQVQAPAPIPPAQPIPPAPQAPIPPAPEAQPVAPALVEIKSPMVGTFYAQPEPGADPYVRVGSHVKPGQTLCIIEAMKIMNPLDAEISGLIKEVVVQDAQPVEFGQVLFRVDPNG